LPVRILMAENAGDRDDDFPGGLSGVSLFRTSRGVVCF